MYYQYVADDDIHRYIPVLEHGSSNLSSGNPSSILGRESQQQNEHVGADRDWVFEYNPLH